MAPPSNEPDEARQLGQALRRLRERQQLSQEEAAVAFGVESREAWRKYEVGAAPGIFKPMVQKRLTGALGLQREDLLAEAQRGGGPDASPSSAAIIPFPRQTLDMLPLRDRVQAGAWLVADDYTQAERHQYPALRDPRYPQADQWLSEVVGDSVDKLGISSGDFVHLVDAGAVRMLRTDDIVEVERLRFNGQERELTLKQVELLPNGMRLWPRSHNPRWTEPLDVLDGAREGEEEIVVRVRGLVLASIRRF